MPPSKFILTLYLPIYLQFFYPQFFYLYFFSLFLLFISSISNMTLLSFHVNVSIIQFILFHTFFLHLLFFYLFNQIFQLCNDIITKRKRMLSSFSGYFTKGSVPMQVLVLNGSPKGALSKSSFHLIFHLIHSCISSLIHIFCISILMLITLTISICNADFKIL